MRTLLPLFFSLSPSLFPFFSLTPSPCRTSGESLHVNILRNNQPMKDEQDCNPTNHWLAAFFQKFHAAGFRKSVIIFSYVQKVNVNHVLLNIWIMTYITTNGVKHYEAKYTVYYFLNCIFFLPEVTSNVSQVKQERPGYFGPFSPLLKYPLKALK